MQKLKFYLFFVVVLLNTLVVSAQAPGNPGSGPVGGIVFLLLTALGIGVYKLRKTTKN